MDLQHGLAYFKAVVVKASTEYDVSADSNLVVITAGVRQRIGESRLELVGRNLRIFQHIVPQIVKHSPNAVLCVVSNPCESLRARCDLVCTCLPSCTCHPSHPPHPDAPTGESGPSLPPRDAGDIMTYVTWKLSGFPLERVFGSGTALDSARFR